MKWWILSILITTTIVVVGGTESNPDYSLAKLVENNELLTEIDVHRRKVDNFIERWGNFFGYVVKEVQWHNQKYSRSHEHSTHSPTMIIEEECVTHLEELNGYLDYVVDTRTMDSITSKEW